VALSCVGLPLIRATRPFTTRTSAWEQALPWIYPASLLGAISVLVTLSRGRALLDRVDPWNRIAGELGSLWLGVILLQLPILGGALLSGAAPSAVGAGLVAILTTALHLASVGLLLLIPPISSLLRTSLFLAAVWLVPSLCASDPALARLGVWLDVRSPLRSQALPGLLPSLASALALLTCASLLRSAPARKVSG
jgi:hypothetical protein